MTRPGKSLIAMAAFFFNPKNSGKSLNVFSRNTFHDQIHIF